MELFPSDSNIKLVEEWRIRLAIPTVPVAQSGRGGQSVRPTLDDEALRLGLRGINLEPGAYAEPLFSDDRRLYPIYAYCEDLAIPVTIMAGGSAGPDLSYTAPVHVDRVAADFPRLAIAITHGGWPWVREMLHIAFRRPNVYLSPDQYLCNMPGMQDWIDAANGFLAERFLYASSYPFIGVKAYAQWFRSLPFEPARLDDLMYHNAQRFLGLAA